MRESLLRVLVTWRLARLYKSSLLCTLLLSISLSAWPVATSHKNWLVLKVSEQIYFFNDLQALYNDLDGYYCAMPDSIIFKVIKLNFKKTEKDNLKTAAENLKEKAPFDPEMIQIWKELKILLKIENYLNSQKVVVVPGLEKQILNLAKGSSCQLGPKQTSAITRFLKVEIFLKSRFNPKSVWITDEEIKKIQAADVGTKLTVNEIKERELERKINESIDMFVKTLERQIPHEDFW